MGKTNREESFDQEQFDKEFFSDEAEDLGLMSGVKLDEEDPEESEESEEEEGQEQEESDEEEDEDPDQDDEEQEDEDEDEESTEGKGQPKGSTEDKPILTLNHQGREIPIKSERDLILLAQQGLDYTVKTQQLSPFRKAIEYLNQHPEAMARLQAQMEGKEAPEQKEKETKKQPIPEQREDETYEEYVARLARESAKQEYEQRIRAEDERERQIAGTMAQIQRDPMFKATVTLMKAEMARGNISQEEYRRADADPSAFVDLYGRYRSAAAAIVRNTPQGNGKKKDDGKAPAKKTRKTFTEKSRARKRPSTRNPREITDKAIEQMGNEDLEQLIERVKGGGGTF